MSRPTYYWAGRLEKPAGMALFIDDNGNVPVRCAAWKTHGVMQLTVYARHRTSGRLTVLARMRSPAGDAKQAEQLPHLQVLLDLLRAYAPAYKFVSTTEGIT